MPGFERFVWRKKDESYMLGSFIEKKIMEKKC